MSTPSTRDATPFTQTCETPLLRATSRSAKYPSRTHRPSKSVDLDAVNALRATRTTRTEALCLDPAPVVSVYELLE